MADREVAAIRAEKDARTSEEEVMRLRAELDGASREVVEMETRNRDLAAQLKDSAERFRAVERSGSPSTTEGLTDVLHAAERALARLTDAARKSAEEELGETERARAALQAEIEGLDAWRGRVTPMISSVRRSIDEARATSAALVACLAELAEIAAPPVAEREPIIVLEEPASAPPAAPVVEPSPGPWATDRAARPGAG
jgi:hypothetical protein